jgi:hypothetical protein
MVLFTLSSIIAFPLIYNLSGFALGIFFLELFSAAIAGIDERFCFELAQGGFVNGTSGALDALGIVMEPEPR